MTLLFALLLSAPNAPYRPDDFTSLLLHFDEGKGSMALDASGFDNHCQVRGAKWTEGKFGKALDFRQGGVAIVPFHPSLQPSTEFTLEVWVWVEGPSEEIQRIAFRSGLYGFYLRAKSTSLLFFVNAGGKWESVSAPIPTRRWVHLAGVYDGREMRLYVGGELKARREKRGKVMEGRVPLVIGADNAEGKWQLRGMVDEIRLSLIARKKFDPAEILRFEPTTEFKEVSPESVTIQISLPRLRIGRCDAPPAIDGKLNDPVWREAARARLACAPPGQKITQPAWAYVAYDDENLFIAFRCNESRMDQIVAERRERDSDVWLDDCVEVFLMPRPETGAYFHLVVNPLGTLYDCRHDGGREVAWDSSARVATSKRRNGWDVEMAIPFERLGVRAPRPGEVWRANFCREERPHEELSAWSPVEGSFHRPERFGLLEFSLRPEVRPEEWSIVKGLLRDASGRRLAGVKVLTTGGIFRTDSLGYFEARMRKGRNLLLISDPRYELLAGEVTIKADEERLVLPPLKPINPYEYKFSLPPSPKGYWLVPVNWLDDLDPKTPSRVPSAESPVPKLETFATPGEFEPLSFVLYAQRNLKGVKVEASPLRSEVGEIPVPEVRFVVRYFRRWWYYSPPNEGAFVSRFLLKFGSLDLPAQNFCQFWLTIHVPEDAKAGVYKGKVKVAPQNAPPSEVDVSVRVLPFKLRWPPHKRHALYYWGRHTQYPEEMREGIVRKELADIRAHGARLILWSPAIRFRKVDNRIVFDYEDVREKLRLLREFGFEGPYIVWTGLNHLARLLGHKIDTRKGAGWEGLDRDERFLDIAKRALKGLLKLREEEGFPEIVVTHMDEVFSAKRLPLYIALTKAVRQIPELRVYITFHNRPRPGVAEKIRQIDPYVDIRCYHGHSVDEWLGAGHSFDELAEELRRSGDEAWTYYNPRSLDVTPEWMRIVNGIWLWLSPISVHCPWIYNSYRGSPLDDSDGHDYGFAFPVPMPRTLPRSITPFALVKSLTSVTFVTSITQIEIVPTRLWEAYREGVDDLRYLWTLECAIREHGREKPKEAEQARRWLEDLKRRILGLKIEQEQSALVKAIAENFSGEDFQRMREECARLIEALISK